MKAPRRMANRLKTADSMEKQIEATMLAVSKLEELRSSAAPVAGGDTVDARGQPPQGAESGLSERRWSGAALSPYARILPLAETPDPQGLTGREVRNTGGWVQTP